MSDKSLVKKLRSLVKECVPYAIERDYRRRRYGLVNHWDSRKTSGSMKKAARFWFELLPYGVVQRYMGKKYPPPKKAKKKPEPAPKPLVTKKPEPAPKPLVTKKPEPASKPLVTVKDGLVPFSPEKPNCIIVAHESSRTGCPINTWSMLCELNKTFNVLAISLKAGPLDPIFNEKSTWCAIADESIRYKSEELETWLTPILDMRPYEFAIANSVCTWALLPVLSWHRIPSIVCIHEFAQYCNMNDLKAAFLYGTTVVFSSHLCLKATGDLLNIDVGNVPVMAQGKSGLPVDKSLRFDGREWYLIANLKRRKAENGEFVVLGVGSVEYRKGFDLFLRTASEIQRKCSSRRFRFIWAGNGYDPETNFISKLYKAQIDTLGLSDSFEYLGPVKFIDKVYQLSDLFLLTSVLDPLPGVVIEAMSHKVPALCFDKASGFPEMFQAAGLSSGCVVDYLSVEKMSDRAIELVHDDDARRKLAESQYSFCLHSFDMPDYVARIVALAPKARESFIVRTKSAERDTRDRFLEALRATTAHEIGLADSSRTAYLARSFAELHPVIYGLEPSVKDLASHATEELFWNLTGGNTGNLAFHRALYAVLAEAPKVLPWHSEEPLLDGSVGILPCANQLAAHCDMSLFADWLLKSDIPMVAIGVGAQSRLKLGPSVLDYEMPYLHGGTVSWIRRMAEHAPTGKPNISARGRFTMNVLRSVGVSRRAVALGCPTLFISPEVKLGARISEKCGRFDRVAYAAGQMNWPINLQKLENSLSKIITDCDGAFVVQAALPELKMVRGEYFTLDDKTRDETRRHFREDLSEQEFANWCMRYGHVFFDVDEWMDFYRKFDFVVGPRIHGVMIALQAGVPALCIAIDSRTTELCEIMKVPYVSLTDVKNGVSLDDLKRLFKFDPLAFDKNRKDLAAGFADFLLDNKIRPSLHLLRIAGRST